MGLPSDLKAATAVVVVSKGVSPPSSPSTTLPSHKKENANEGSQKPDELPALKREMSTWQCASWALTSVGTYGSVVSTFTYALNAGGAAGIIWMWVAGGLGALTLSFSLAELCSAYPSSGSSYFALAYLAPEHQVPLLAWLCGWMSMFGTVSSSASGQYAVSKLLLSAISIITDGEYKPKTSHTVGVMAGTAAVMALINCLPNRHISQLNIVSSVLNVGLLVAIMACLLALTDDKHSAGYVFTDFQPLSGWTPAGFAILFGTLSSTWCMTKPDSPARMADEMQHPAADVPKTIVTAQVFSFTLGLILNVVLVFCLGDPVGLISSPGGQPVGQLLLNSMGRDGALFFVFGALASMALCLVTSVQAGSRTIYAYARDDLVPLSHVWRRVTARTQVPLASVWLFSAACVVVNLLALASDAAIAAVFNVCITSLNVSYLIPIACKLLYGRFTPGPFSLGRWSAPLNCVALGWNLFLGVLYFFPTVQPVTATNMNYASVVFVLVLGSSLMFWHFRGRHYYQGPCASVQFCDKQLGGSVESVA